MNICPICDKKIVGTWCKSCHRFVTPWHLNDGIHINESHSAKHDEDCDYHNPVVTIKAPDYVQKTSSTTSGTNYNSSNSKKSDRNKNNKTGKLLVSIYVFFIICGVLFSILAGFLEGASVESITDLFTGKKEVETAEHKNAEFISDLKLDAKHQYLANVDVENWEEEAWGTVLCYYNPEKIEKLGVECDASHFDFNADEVFDYLKMITEDLNLEVYEDYSTSEMNYLMDNGEEQTTYFDVIDELANDTFFLDVDSDVVTGKVHEIYFCAKGSNGEKDECYVALFGILSFMDPKTYGTLEDVIALVKNPPEDMIEYQEEEYYISIHKDKELFTLDVFPKYEK